MEMSHVICLLRFLHFDLRALWEFEQERMIIPQASWLDDCLLCPSPMEALLMLVEGSSPTNKEVITLSLGPCSGRKPVEIKGVMENW